MVHAWYMLSKHSCLELSSAPTFHLITQMNYSMAQILEAVSFSADKGPNWRRGETMLNIQKGQWSLICCVWQLLCVRFNGHVEKDRDEF